MSVLLLPPIFQFFDNNGDPLANGFVYTYAAGTTTALATHTDSTGTVAAPNPIPLNAAGRPNSGSGAIWGQGAYKFIVRDANGTQIGDPLDNVISFNSLADATNAYAQTFSGNGTQTVFTASDDLGTDPKALLVSTAKGLEEIAQNGSFTTDTLWTKGAGWTIAAGVATATGAISTAISQVPVLTVVAGQAYAVTYTMTRSAGGLIPSIGGQAGVERTASGTYREIIIAAASTPLAWTGNGFTGTLDSVSVTVATSQPMALLPSSAYTISGTTLTFASAPALGVNNIDVRAPSLLLGAASSAASLAQLYAANALVSQTAAAASAELAAESVKWKPAVACATTANITLSGEQTIDTVLTSASRVLVKDQTNATENGVYVSAAGSWTRAIDADTWTEIQSQAVFTSGGSANINKSWVNTNEAGGTIGVTDITWTQLQAFAIETAAYNIPNNLGISASVAANALTINITDASGATPSTSSPVTIPFRSSTLTSGTVSSLTLTSALSLTISSGSTLGILTNGLGFRLWLVAFDDAGTVRLGIMNCSLYNLGTLAATIFPLPESGVGSSTAEGGAGGADSAGVIYTGTAVTSKAYRILGYIEYGSGLAAFGTWNASPTTIQIFGPGVKRPGERVQSTTIFSSSGSSVNSTTFTDVTGTTLALTPTATSNFLAVNYTASTLATVGGAGVNSESFGRIAKAGTGVGQENRVGIVTGAGANAQTAGTFALRYMENPNSTSSVSYTLQHKGLNTATTTTNSVMGFIEEIMG